MISGQPETLAISWQFNNSNVQSCQNILLSAGYVYTNLPNTYLPVHQHYSGPLISMVFRNLFLMSQSQKPENACVWLLFCAKQCTFFPGCSAFTEVRLFFNHGTYAVVTV